MKKIIKEKAYDDDDGEEVDDAIYGTADLLKKLLA